ncbi:hypothetical protein ACSBR2_036095 [Camellia fascicularis]
MRDWRGNLLDGITTTVQASSTTQGEARAVQMACAFSQTLNLSHVQVENDNQNVIDLSVSELVPPWDFQAVIHDIYTTSLDATYHSIGLIVLNRGIG